MTKKATPTKASPAAAEPKDEPKIEDEVKAEATENGDTKTEEVEETMEVNEGEGEDQGDEEIDEEAEKELLGDEEGEVTTKNTKSTQGPPRSRHRSVIGQVGGRGVNLRIRGSNSILLKFLGYLLSV